MYLAELSQPRVQDPRGTRAARRAQLVSLQPLPPGTVPTAPSEGFPYWILIVAAAFLLLRKKT